MSCIWPFLTTFLAIQYHQWLCFGSQNGKSCLCIHLSIHKRNASILKQNVGETTFLGLVVVVVVVVCLLQWLDEVFCRFFFDRWRHLPVDNYFQWRHTSVNGFLNNNMLWHALAFAKS